MTTHFRFNNGGTIIAFEDAFIRRDSFSSGGLWGWGDNASPNGGSLGDNTSVTKSSPVQTIAGGTNWKQLARGYFHEAAIKTDGTLWMWGNNGNGQLGDNTGVAKSSPVQTIASGTIWRQVSCGQFCTAAIKTDGTLWTWGYNGFGQLGDNTVASKSSPVQTIAGGWIWKQVSCGLNITAAIKSDGTLWLWGYNQNGQTGDNTIVGKSSPVQTIAAGTPWKQVSCGHQHVGAIKTDGTLWMWGYNYNGQIGDNTVAHKSSPVQTIAGGTNWKQVTGGASHTAAIKQDGTLWAWGRNDFGGPLGDNTLTSKSSPVQTVSGGNNWKQLSCGYFHTASIKTDGTLWVWGYGVDGELGDNTSTSKSSPVQTIAAGTNWKQVSAGFYGTAAITDIF